MNFMVKEVQFQHIKFAVFHTLFNEKVEKKSFLRRECLKQRYCLKHCLSATKKTIMSLIWKRHLTSFQYTTFVHCYPEANFRFNTNGNAIEQTGHELVIPCAIQFPNKLIAYYSISPTIYTELKTCLKRVYSLELFQNCNMTLWTSDLFSWFTTYHRWAYHLICFQNSRENFRSWVMFIWEL